MRRTALFLAVFAPAAIAAAVMAACGSDDTTESGKDSGPQNDATSSADTNNADGSSVADGSALDGSPSSADADAALEAGAWSPANLTGLALWLDGARGFHTDGGANLATWDDQSGHKNNAATTTAPGTVIVDALDAGRSSAHFASGLMSIADDPSLQWGATNDVLLSMVLSITNTTGFAFIWVKETLANGVGLQDVWGVSGGNDLTTAMNINGPFARVNGTYNDGAFRILSLRRHGATTLEVRVNGVPTAITVDASDVSAADAAAVIGGLTGGPGYLAGDVAEIVGVSASTISDADVGKLETYLGAKYSIALEADAGLP